MALAENGISEERRLDMIALLEGCGVQPDHIPLDTPIQLRDGKVHLIRFILTEDGAKLFDPVEEGPMTEEFFVEPPDHLIPDWLRG